MTRLITDLIDPAALTAAVSSPLAGAVVLFLGTVRELTGTDITVALEYDAYVLMAEAKLAALEADVRARWPVTAVALVHRLGRLEVGDVSVAVAVSSPHRPAAFEAARYAIDALKVDVPIWKKDVRPAGDATWVHPATEGAAE
jgi:molybdopterin synthase catalytic subunit